MILFMLCCVAVGVVCDYYIFHSFALNYLLLSMAFSATATNIMNEEKYTEVNKGFSPILSLSLLLVIVNLGMPLDYKDIAGAGLFTAIYIISRAIGKIGGAFLGSHITKCDKSVQKYLGLTLLSHSGVSLVFTGIAVSTIQSVDPESAAIIQGTIVAAAIINEIIAVILAKVAFTKSGEI
jgi:Kef-type K+ transport system membrane component KefB